MVRILALTAEKRQESKDKRQETRDERPEDNCLKIGNLVYWLINHFHIRLGSSKLNIEDFI